MENVCRNCNHWEPTAPIVTDRENYGECNKLSHIESKMDPDYLIPVLDHKKVLDEQAKEIEYLTGANFGCNQFASA